MRTPEDLHMMLMEVLLDTVRDTEPGVGRMAASVQRFSVKGAGAHPNNYKI